MPLGQAIKLCRNSRSLSRSELAMSVGCSVSYLSLIENEKRDPSVATVRQIAKALEVPLVLLFFVASEDDEFSEFSPELQLSISKLTLDLLRSKPKRLGTQ